MSKATIELLLADAIRMRSKYAMRTYRYSRHEDMDHLFGWINTIRWLRDKLDAYK